jgi:hypothetical protein
MKATQTPGTILLLAFLTAIPLPALAQDFVAARGTGAAATQETATKEAYYSIFDRALTGVAGNQAAETLGGQFRRDFDRDFDAFKSRYFSADTNYRCMPQPDRHYLCEVQGMLRMAAIQSDLRKVVRNTEQTLSNRLVFVLSAAEAGDPRAAFVVDSLSGKFTASGHRIVTGSAANAAIGARQVDYALGIYEVRFSTFDYDTFSQRMTGSLSVRFRLSNPKTKTQVANLPVEMTATLPGPSRSALESAMVSELSNRAAAEIGRKVNEAVIGSQVERAADVAGQARAQSGRTLYLIRLEGLSQRNRDEIRGMRQTVSAILNDAAPEVDPSQSTNSRVTLRFDTSRRFTPDDLVDAFYKANAARLHFEAEYVGSNEFIAHY